MTLAFWVYAFAVVFTRTRAIILERERACELGARERCARIGLGSAEMRHELEQRRRILRHGRLRPLRLGRLRGDRCSAWRSSRCCAAPRALAAARRGPGRRRRGATHEAAPQAPGDRRRRGLPRSAPPPRWSSTRSRATWCSSTRRRRSRRNEAPHGAHLPHRRHGGRGHASSATARTVSFVVTDTAKSIPVRYEGILPDLFKEGKGVVAQGQLHDGVFVASEVLAKHDENYMPPEAAEALKKAQQGQPQARRDDLGRADAKVTAMIPELGHFAALARARRRRRARHAAAGRRARGNRADWMALARPSARGPVRARRPRLRLPGARPSSATTSRCSTSRPTRTARCRWPTASPRPGAATRARCCCGC